MLKLLRLGQATSVKLDPTLPRSSQQRQLLTTLKKILPASALLYRDEELAPYVSFASHHQHRCKLLAVTIPETEDQIAAILQTCHQLAIPVTPRGAGTTMPMMASHDTHDGIILCLSRLNRILQIDPSSGTARVQCGVKSLTLNQAAARYGLHYAPDPADQIACTLGGGIATDTRGLHSFKYGSTLQHVLEVRGYTMSGQAFQFGSCCLDQPGLDVLGAFIGSQGQLGIATEILLKLQPAPANKAYILATFPSLQQTTDALACLIEAGVIPTSLQIMDQSMTRALEGLTKAGYHTKALATLLCELDGSLESTSHDLLLIQDIFQTLGALDLKMSQDANEYARFENSRKTSLFAIQRISPHHLSAISYTDLQCLPLLLEGIKELQYTYGLRCLNTFFAETQALHTLILFDMQQSDEYDYAQQFKQAVDKLNLALNKKFLPTAIETLEKQRDALEHELLSPYPYAPSSSQEQRQLQLLKKALDPSLLLRPHIQVLANACAEP